MPYKHTKKKIPVALDRRRKLTNDDRAYIKQLHKENMPVREIARIFEAVCSRRLIQFVIFPERLKELQKQGIANKKHLKYYNRDKWREVMREHRHYKQNLYIKKKLI